jgi:hypothetical protein
MIKICGDWILEITESVRRKILVLTNLLTKMAVN